MAVPHPHRTLAGLIGMIEAAQDHGGDLVALRTEAANLIHAQFKQLEIQLAQVQREVDGAAVSLLAENAAREDLIANINQSEQLAMTAQQDFFRVKNSTIRYLTRMRDQNHARAQMDQESHAAFILEVQNPNPNP